MLKRESFKQKNMYNDSIKQWNVAVGCKFDCVYCTRSFKAQMKRQKWNCDQCYKYEPHFHEERLTESLPNTIGDEFIWACSSGDIRFIPHDKLEKVFDRMRQLPHKQFFMQTKDATVFQEHAFPPNMWLGITLETNRDEGYEQVSKAPPPTKRFADAKKVKIDIVTIEPIQDFDLDILVEWIRQLAPKRVYIGYDTKNCGLNEPDLAKTSKLITELRKFTIVNLKLLREKWQRYKNIQLYYTFFRRLESKNPQLSTQICKELAQKYCENGNCINPEKYSCCIKENGQQCPEERPCSHKPSLCLHYFCESVKYQVTVQELKEIEKRILWCNALSAIT